MNYTSVTKYKTMTKNKPKPQIYYPVVKMKPVKDFYDPWTYITPISEELNRDFLGDLVDLFEVLKVKDEG